jgi:hypothetical protein
MSAAREAFLKKLNERVATGPMVSGIGGMAPIALPGMIGLAKQLRPTAPRAEVPKKEDSEEDDTHPELVHVRSSPFFLCL